MIYIFPDYTAILLHYSKKQRSLEILGQPLNEILANEFLLSFYSLIKTSREKWKQQASIAVHK